MLTAAVLILAGGLGAVTRALIDALGRRWPGTRTGGPGESVERPTIPWPTTAINVTGSLAAGVVAGVVDGHTVAGPRGSVMAVGFLGAYTTFSTAMLQIVDLLAAGARARALVHAVVPLTAGVGAAAVGWALAGWAVAG